MVAIRARFLRWFSGVGTFPCGQSPVMIFRAQSLPPAASAFQTSPKYPLPKCFSKRYPGIASAMSLTLGLAPNLPYPASIAQKLNLIETTRFVRQGQHEGFKTWDSKKRSGHVGSPPTFREMADCHIGCLQFRRADSPDGHGQPSRHENRRL